ncbi:hypothetical protein NV379_02640 [Paenibacillus sp. N1-5-1-14]|uniref:hypothetical protein n=1 Tax=Paenibacillus radicibacter TaxID=2972488 RepID=UPI0021591A11|nr:hypothetical protein [Paenibacillus radicibacter]MCR8641544.1 hypothetical protein [Paenibacillus radicibacter]
MNETDLELKLLYGCPIPIEGVGMMLPPKLADIIKLGETNYNQFLSTLLFDKDNIDLASEAAEYNNLQILCSYCYHHEDFRTITLQAIEFFFKEKAHLGYDESNVFFYFGSELENRKIDNEKLDLIQFVLKKMNFFKTSKEPEYNPANSKAKQMIDLIMKNKKNKPKPKETMNLHSIISGMAWKSNNVNIINVFDLTIYQLYQGFRVMENIDNYEHTLTGIYSGNVNSKEINFSQLHWAKIIES